VLCSPILASGCTVSGNGHEMSRRSMWLLCSACCLSVSYRPSRHASSQAQEREPARSTGYTASRLYLEGELLKPTATVTLATTVLLELCGCGPLLPATVQPATKYCATLASALWAGWACNNLRLIDGLRTGCPFARWAFASSRKD
jgi:hypothetical protein